MLVGVLEGARDVVGLLHLGHVHPAEVILVIVDAVTPVRVSTIFARVAQPTELGGPDGHIGQAVRLQQVVHDLDATEGEAVAAVGGRQFVQPALRLVRKAIGMIAEGIEGITRAQEEHPAGVLPLVHRAAVVVAPTIARALDAAHRRQPGADDDGGRVYGLDAVVGDLKHVDVQAGVGRHRRGRVPVQPANTVGLVANLVGLDQASAGDGDLLNRLSPRVQVVGLERAVDEEQDLIWIAQLRECGVLRRSILLPQLEPVEAQRGEVRLNETGVADVHAVAKVGGRRGCGTCCGREDRQKADQGHARDDHSRAGPGQSFRHRFKHAPASVGFSQVRAEV